MTELVTGAGAILGFMKSAIDVTNGLRALAKAPDQVGKIVELQGFLLKAQLAQSALIDEKRNLEEEVVRLKAWDAGKLNYQLHTVGLGAFVYATKPELRVGEPPHWICTQCYEDGRKSILQCHGRTLNRAKNLWTCHRCKLSFEADWSLKPVKHQPSRISVAYQGNHRRIEPISQ